MESNELREQLIELHRELEAATHKDPKEDALSHVMTDIVRIASGEDINEDDSENLRERIEHQASDFEIRHPRAAGILREVTEILAKLGI